MDGNLSKALWIGVSVLLFIAVVTIGLSIFGGMKEASNVANDRIGSMTQSLKDDDFMPYNGKDKNGSDVLSAINNFDGQSGSVIILVATLGGNSGRSLNLDPAASASINIGSYRQYISEVKGTIEWKEKCVVISSGTSTLLTSKGKQVRDAEIRDAENQNLQANYINPSGKFKSHLIYDTNQTIRGIIFAQME